MSDERTSDLVETVDVSRRDFIMTATRVLAGVGVACALTPFVSSWRPNANTLPEIVSVDLRDLTPGNQLTVAWQGKPVLVIHRTKKTQQTLLASSTELRDPDSHVPQQPEYARNALRSLRPDYLVLVAVCTHLGCTPHYHATNVAEKGEGGFVCPCHGSRFDLAGRVYKHVPAPINLLVPPHRFVDDHTLLIGEDA